MVPIPAGTFTMGSPDGEPGRQPDEGPQHQVTLPAFFIGKLEVTWDEYDQFGFKLDLQRKRKLGVQLPQDAGDAVTRPTPPYADESWGWGKEKQPVVGITQYAAVKYCEWLSARTGKKYRLPTEAEWEYAARAGTRTAYSFGDDAARDRASTRGCAATPRNSRTSADRRSPTRGASTTCTATWPSGPAISTCRTRTPPPPPPSPFRDPGKALYPHVVRGGSWDDEPGKLRSAARRSSAESWSRRDPQNPKITLVAHRRDLRRLPRRARALADRIARWHLWHLAPFLGALHE